MADRLRDRLTLRWRMALFGAGVVIVILVLSGLLLAVGLRAVLVSNAVTAAEVRAQDLAALLDDGSLPDPIPIAGQDEAMVQIVTDGRVAAASSNIQGEEPLDLPKAATGQLRRDTLSGLPIGDDDRFEVVSLTTPSDAGSTVIHVAVSLEEIDEAVGAATQIGLIGLPLLALAVAAAMWVVIGRTLQPIDAIRKEADEIGGEALNRRVPEPPTADEVGRLARTVNRMLARIQDSVQRQRRFVGDAAHELRSPIASLRTQLETARGATQPPNWDDVSADLLDETLRMQRLTEQLLMLARLDAADMNEHATAVDLDEIIEMTVVEWRAMHGDANIDLADVEPVQIAGDPVLLTQVVRNLIDNATRHASAHVAIHLDWHDDHAVLAVDDDGAGIPPDRRTVVFERFHRLDQARTRDAGGAGLGLALVDDIARAHRGTVRALDAPELGGARIEIRLPRPD
jgi:signal transduction histidine kinase